MYQVTETEKLQKKHSSPLVTLNVKLGFQGQLMKRAMSILMSQNVLITKGQRMQLLISLIYPIENIKVIHRSHMGREEECLFELFNMLEDTPIVTDDLDRRTVRKSNWKITDVAQEEAKC